MGDENLGADLFGDPVQSRQDGRGRPEHVWTLEKSNRVLLMFAAGRSPKEAATAIGVSVPTLRKHYFFEVAQREAASLRFEATQLERLNEAAKGGNVAAEKELLKYMQRVRLEQLSDRVAKRGAAQAKPKAVGKKEAATIAAKAVGGKFAPPPGPTLLN